MADKQFVFIDQSSRPRSKRDEQSRQSRIRSIVASQAHARRSKARAASGGSTVENLPLHLSSTALNTPPDTPTAAKSEPSDQAVTKLTFYNDGRESLPSPTDTNEDSGSTQAKHNEPVNPVRVNRIGQAPPFSLPVWMRQRSLTDLVKCHPGFGGYRTELYRHLPHHNDTETLHTLDFYSQIMTPNLDLVCELFNVSNIFSAFLEIMGSNVFFPAGLVLVRLIAEQLQRPGAPPSPFILQWRGRALAKMIQRVKQANVQEDDELLYAMVFLGILDAGIGDLDSHLTHWNQVDQLVRARGGVRRMRNNTYMKRYLLMFDWVCASQTGNSIFADARRPYRPIHPTYPFPPGLEVTVRRLPVGFQAVIYECKLSYDALAVLARALDTKLEANTTSAIIQRGKRRRDVRKYADFFEACPILGAPDSAGPLIERLICLALMVYCALVFDTARAANGVFLGPKFELSNKITAAKTQTKAETECLIWAYAVAIDSWRTVTGNDVLRKGHVLLKTVKERFPESTSTWKEAERILTKFFWTMELSQFWSSRWETLDG